MTDIKDLLAEAIGEEPPIGIDRDEVFRAGRQRVRRRRVLAALSTVAAVVVAVVGATVLTDFVEVTPDEVPPAAEAPHAPPGPELPLTPSTDADPSTLTTVEHATQLTQALYDSGYLTAAMARPWPGRSGTPGFRAQDDEYLYEADITRADRQGSLQVTVGAAPAGSSASCDNLGERYDSCTLTAGVVQATWKDPAGERRDLAMAVLPDGTEVAAVVTNFPRTEEELGKSPHGELPLTMDELTKLITKSGFRVR
jgi:hypothetical protein